MPSFRDYQRINLNIRDNNQRMTNGYVKKHQSDQIMEATWDDDLESCVAYFYDYEHDDDKFNNYNLEPWKSNAKVPVDIKFIINSYNSENKDQVGFHIQFKPSFEWETVSGLDYYKDVFVNKYNADFPIGLYVDIPDGKGIYRKWMVVEDANNYGLQFPTWTVLPCDHLFQWIHKNKRYQMYGVSRSQNSYSIMRFIVETLCRKFSNCWDILLGHQYYKVVTI